jgi:hypothetical protein
MARRRRTRTGTGLGRLEALRRLEAIMAQVWRAHPDLEQRWAPVADLHDAEHAAEIAAGEWSSATPQEMATWFVERARDAWLARHPDYVPSRTGEKRESAACEAAVAALLRDDINDLIYGGGGGGHDAA